MCSSAKLGNYFSALSEDIICGWSHTCLEVDAAVAVLVEYPEDLVDEDGGVAGGQDHRVHIQHLRLV